MLQNLNKLDWKKAMTLVLLWECAEGNPNGDPERDNVPRHDPNDMRALVSPMCMKRKIRNYVRMKYGADPGFDLYVADGSDLREQKRRAYKGSELANNTTPSKNLGREDVRKREAERARVLCEMYFDIRWFGGVLSTGQPEGLDTRPIRGPLQVGWSASVDPVFIMTPMIVRKAVDGSDGDEGSDSGREKSGRVKENTLGETTLLRYALFKTAIYWSPVAAEATGANSAQFQTDMERALEALLGGFELTRSASSGAQAPVRLVAWQHDCPYGSYPAGRLRDRVRATLLPGIDYPTSANDYTFDIDTKGLPKEVKPIVLFDSVT